jgi:hypothetical protein
MALNMVSQSAKIGIRTTPGKLLVDREDYKIQLQKNSIELNINTEQAKVIIDQYPSFASAGLKNTRDLTQENVQIGKSAVLEYMAKISRDGDRMAQITNKGDAIVEIAQREASNKRDFNITFLPKERPNISFEGSVEINWTNNWEGHTNGVTVDVQEGYINLQYQKGTVEIYMQQREKLEIEYNKGQNIDLML